MPDLGSVGEAGQQGPPEVRVMEGQAEQWPWGCRGWCVLALALWRGWLSWRWQDNGNPRKGGSSGRGTRPWEGDAAVEGGLGTEAKKMACWVVLSHGTIFTPYSSAVRAPNKKNPQITNLCLPPCQLCPTVFVSHGESGGCTSEAQLYVREGRRPAIPGFQPCGHSEPWAGPPRIRATTLQVCSLHASRRRLDIRVTRPVINSASRENAENTHHLRIHVPAESAYIKSIKFGGRMNWNRASQVIFLFLRELFINWCKSSNLVKRALPPHVWREHSCTENPPSVRGRWEAHIQPCPLPPCRAGSCLSYQAVHYWRTCSRQRARRALLTFPPSTTEKEKPSLQE